jgi:serine/threonine protein phosphatase PrpC
MEETRETVPVSIPPVGWACGCSRRGTSHTRDGRPCQDTHAIWSSSFMGEPILVVAVADGHGGGRHDLSHCGAALAVQAAVSEVIASLPVPGGDGAWRPVSESGDEEFHNRVTARWKGYVMADAGQRPGLSPGGGDGQDLLSRYGTTLLIALIDGSECWVGQIGDGDILLVRPDGSIEIPIPKDETLLGTVTYSLSSRDSPGLWRTARFTVGKGGLLLMATDGLSDSFENPEAEFQVFARSLFERVTGFGIERVGSALPGWLDGFSLNGSGDDMTLALVSLNPSPGTEEPEQQAPEAGSAAGNGTGSEPGGETGSGPGGEKTDAS